MKLLSICKLLQCKRISIKRLLFHIQHYFPSIDSKQLPHNITFLKNIFIKRIKIIQTYVKEKIYKKTLLDKFKQIYNKDFSFSENTIDLQSGEDFTTIDISNIICVQENNKYYLFTKDFFIEYLYHNKHKPIKNPYTNIDFSKENQDYIKKNTPNKTIFHYKDYDIYDKERFINSTFNNNVYYITNDYFNFNNIHIYKKLYYELYNLYNRLYFKTHNLKNSIKKKIFKYKQKTIDLCDNINNLKNILIDTIFKFIISFQDNCQDILLYVDYIELLFLIFNQIEENIVLEYQDEYYYLFVFN
jgi:hypothetical protein